MQETEKKTSPESDMTMTWMKMGMDFWQGIAKPWFDPARTTPSQAAADSDVFSAMDSAMKKWMAFSNAMSSSGSMDALFKGAGTLPTILAQMAQHTYAGFATIQQKWMERIGRMGETGEAYRFQHLDQNMFRAWRETYEKEFQRFFQLPQLGLTRSYQEKMQQALDKYAVYQSTMAEFVRVLCLPLNRSITVMDEKLAEMAKTGNLPADSKEYYRLWVKILEGHYMSLYQSSEYLEILSKTLTSLTDYANARNAVFEDMLSMVPIPGRKEIDDLEREVYELKNRLKAVEARGQTRSPKKGNSDRSAGSD